MLTQRIDSRCGIRILENMYGLEQVVNICITYTGFAAYEVDRSLEAVLTVLLKARGANVGLCYIDEAEAGEGSIGPLTEPSEIEEWLSYKEYNDNYIVIINARNQELFEGFNAPEGYRSLDDIVLWMNDKGVSAKAYTSKEEKKTFVVIRDINAYIYHIITFLASRLVPWVFDAEPLSDEEKDLLMSLYNDNMGDFTRKINTMSNNLFNFRELSIRNALDGYGKKYVKRMGDDIQREIQMLYDEINDLSNKINERNRRILQKSIMFAGLDSVVNEQMDDLISFTLAAKNIEVVDADGPYITFQLTSDLTNYDIDDAEAVIDNGDAYIYRMNSRWTRSQEEALLKAIFVDQIFVIKMIAVFKINFVSGEIMPIRGFSVLQGYENYMLNQHIFRHACLGGNDEQIRQFLANRDYTGALSACVAATGNININEPASNESFFTDLFTTEKPVLRYNGSDITVDQAMEIIGVNG